MTAPTTLEQTTSETQEEADDRFAHYVVKDQIVEAAVEGTPLLTLCNKLLIPKADPHKLPICGICADEFEKIKNFMGE